MAKCKALTELAVKGLNIAVQLLSSWCYDEVVHITLERSSAHL